MSQWQRFAPLFQWERWSPRSQWGHWVPTSNWGVLGATSQWGHLATCLWGTWRPRIGALGVDTSVGALSAMSQREPWVPCLSSGSTGRPRLYGDAVAHISAGASLAQLASL